MAAVARTTVSQVAKQLARPSLNHWEKLAERDVEHAAQSAKALTMNFPFEGIQN